jgi:putative ABC transport system permease protein
MKPNRLSWPTTFKIAWRQSRASTGKFLFVVLAVAAGVGSLTGVRSFSGAFRTMLLKEARTLMAADLTVRTFDLPRPDQLEVIRRLEAAGVRTTRVTETLSMMASKNVADPVLVSVKAVDPAVYPFYGSVRMEPGGPLASQLTDNAVAISDDLLLRLHVRVGDAVRLGGLDLKVAAVVTMEPDRLSGSLNVGPRVMITRDTLERSGLIQPGSRSAQRFLFKLPEGGPGVTEVRRRLGRVFQRSLIADYRETHPLITRALNRSTRFLSMVSLVAMIVGALGVAMAIQGHLKQKMDTIAVMKAVGAQSGDIMRIYVVQTLMLAVTGSLLGIGIGAAVQGIFPELISRYLPLRPELGWDWFASIQGLAIGVLSTLLFTVPPLLSIRDIRPVVILRRDMAEAKGSLKDRWEQAKLSVAVGAVILLCIGAIAAWLAGGSLESSTRMGLIFVGGLIGSLAALSGVAWLLLYGLRAFIRRSPWRLPSTLRHGISNLYRPGNQAPAVLVALGIGVMFTLTIYLVQRSILTELVNSAPPGMPNVFLINITERERLPLLALLNRQPGVEEKPQLVAAVPAKLVSIDNRATEKLFPDGPARRYVQPRAVTWADEKPPYTEVIAGAWWTQRPAETMVSIDDDAAQILHLKPGARLEFNASGRVIVARVAAIHRTESVRPGRNIEFVLSPGALDGLPLLYFGGVRIKPNSVAGLQRAAYEKFPTVSVINVADVVETIQQVVDQIGVVIRFVSGFAILAGAIILASSVAGTRFRRVREVVILKTLGAKRRRVAGIFSVEFLILGAVAGLMGSLLASGFSTIVLRQIMESDALSFDPLSNVLAVVLTAAVATLAGWLASYRILDQKPLEVLRHE